MNRNITVGLAVGFLILSAVGFRFISGMKKPAELKEVSKVVKQVKGLEVKNTSLTTQLEITGRLQAAKKIEVFTEVGGTLLPNGNRFREGNFFKKGAVLVKVDNGEQMLGLLAQKSSLMNQITLMLPDLKSDYPSSFPNWQQYLDKMDVNKALEPLPEPVSDQEKYFVSARNLYNLYYNIQSQEKRMGKFTVHAPFNGALSQAMITEGTLVRAGQKLGEFMNTYTFELEASVNEGDIDLLRRGNKVELFADDKSKSWKGTVIRISNTIDPATQTVKVFISVSGEGLREGMYLSGTVNGRQLDNVFEISRNLLIDQDKVFLIQDSLLKIVEVEPLYLTSQNAIVSGLPNESIMMNEALIGAYEGLKVNTYFE
ncbi:MAG: HlyD family efflux transporter periplasmic adaptor subunit [Bacteroidota bacterium]